MISVTITIPGPPMGKQRARVLKTGRAYTPAKTKAWEAQAAMLGKAAMSGRQPFETPMTVVITALMPIPASWSKKKKSAAIDGGIRPITKPDFDNIAKIVGDALNQVVWKDDSQIVDGSCHKYYSETPMVVVQVLV